MIITTKMRLIIVIILKNTNDKSDNNVKHKNNINMNNNKYGKD